MVIPNPLVIVLMFLDRLRKFWFPNTTALLWLLLAFPALLFFQTVVHEGTHDVIARFHSDSPKLAPFPHSSDKGRFQVGVTIAGKAVSPNERKTCDPAERPTTVPARLAGWIGWPQVVALLIVSGLALLFFCVEITNPYAAFLLRAWLFGAAVDFLFNSAKILFGSCDPGQDWARVMIRDNIGSTLFWFITLVLWILVFVAIGIAGAREHERPAELDFWDYRWLALLFLPLSVTAILFSWTVSDLKIDKSSFAFWFFLIGQILAAIGYLVYIIAAFRRARPG